MRSSLRRALIFVLLGVVALTDSARAAGLGTDSFVVRRSPTASDCPGEDAILAELRKLSPSPKPQDVPPLQVEVLLDRHENRYRAELDVSGRRQGKRLLEAEGPSCDTLARALVVALAILLDLELPEEPAETVERPTSLEEPQPPLDTRQTRAREPEASRPWARLWVGAGLAGAWDLPYELSLLTRANLWLHGSLWALSIGGLWVPPRGIEHGPGEVQVSLLGGELRACFGRHSFSKALELLPCGVLQVARLKGEGVGFVETRSSRRPWLAAGLEAGLGGPITDRTSWGVSSALLMPLNRERFHVDGVSGSAFASAPLGAYVGGELGLLLW